LANILVEISKQSNVNIAINIPLHVAKRNTLGMHEKIGISLLAEGIHLMPYQTFEKPGK